MKTGYFRNFKGKPSGRILAGVAVLMGVAVFASQAMAADTTRAKPYPAWDKPVINPTLSIEQAKAIVAKRTKPQTEWKGPTEGPKAPEGDFTLAFVSADQSYTPYVLWGNGIKDAAKTLGWKMKVFDGQGSVSGTLSAFQQAVSSQPAAIITTADVNALQKPIKRAIAQNIPIIGIHGTAFPGPAPDLGLYMNIVSDPADIGQAEAAYVIAASDGKAKVIHMVDKSYAIARFKSEATKKPIENCSGCELLETVTMPLADASNRMPSTITGLLSRYGDNWWLTTCCDGYFTNAASALRSAGASPEKIKLVGADAPPSTYDVIRKGGFEVASVPEPSSLFGYMAVDAVIRAMAGQPPAKFLQPVYLLVKSNVDSEGGSNDEFVPNNNFACHYANIWKGEDKVCKK